jgi:hypothetical protein
VVSSSSRSSHENPQTYKSPSKRKKTAVGAKGFFKSEKRKKSSDSFSSYPPSLILESRLAVPNRQKTVKFGWVSSRDPRDIDSIDDYDLSITSPPPRDFTLPALARQQKSYRRFSGMDPEERFDERNRFSTPRLSEIGLPPAPIRLDSSSPRILKKGFINEALEELWNDDERGFVSERIESSSNQAITPSPPRSNIPPSRPIRQESAHGAPEELWDDDEIMGSYANQPLTPSPPRSNSPPSIPIRQESDHRAPKGSWNVVEEEFVSENESVKPFTPLTPSPNRLNNPPSIPIRQESDHRAPEGSWNIDEGEFASE